MEINDCTSRFGPCLHRNDNIPIYREPLNPNIILSLPVDLEDYHQLNPTLPQLALDVVHSLSHNLAHIQDGKEDTQIQAIGARVVY